MKSLNALNVYQINILQNFARAIFQEKFKSINHKYLTRHTSQNFYLSKSSIKTSNFRISYRGPDLWNNFPSSEAKTLASFHASKNHLKKQLFSNDNELSATMVRLPGQGRKGIGGGDGKGRVGEGRKGGEGREGIFAEDL